MKKTTTTIMVAGTAYKVFNKTAQRRNAVAYNLENGKRLQIGNSQEVLDLSDKDDLESRVIAASTKATDMEEIAAIQI